MSRPELTYALNQKRVLVHVDTVPNGNDCNCFCPNCGEKLCAKNGGNSKKRVHHFAHQSGAECEGAIESALHILAKKVLFETKRLRVPSPIHKHPSHEMCFERVVLEQSDHDTGLQPDCACYNGDDCLWVEFKKTHAVDTRKRGLIISKQINCVEIDINDCQLDYEAIKKFLVDDIYHRKWIWNSSIQLPNGDYGYCDKCPREYGCQISFRRTIANDETGRAIDLRKDVFDIDSHSYYCIVCGEPLTIDYCESGLPHFAHLKENIACKDSDYLKEVAKEIIFQRFCKESKFVIKIPQQRKCKEHKHCKLYLEENCFTKDYIEYDIKEYGFSQCIKDTLSAKGYHCDLLLKRDNNDGEIIILLGDSNQTNSTYAGARLIKLYINSDKQLSSLSINPITNRFANLYTFKSECNSTIDCSKIDEQISKLHFYDNGRFQQLTASCSIINSPPINAKHVIYYRDKENNHESTQEYLLWKCFQANRKTCYCNICKSINEATAPQYCIDHRPVDDSFHTKDLPIDCPYFKLDRDKIDRLEQSFHDLKYLEKEFSDDESD